jgi:hypothetical protein
MIGPPVGIVAGAVYIVAGANIEVVVGLNVPHEFAGAQVQLTPKFARSLATLAEILTVPPAGTVAGGVPEKAIVIFEVVEFEELPLPHPLTNTRTMAASTGHFQFIIAP